MVVQAIACAALECVALAVHGSAVLVALGLAYGGSILIAGVHLSLRLRHRLGRGRVPIGASLAKTAAGAAIMVGPAWLIADHVSGLVGPPLGSRIAVLVAAAAGLAIYLAVQTALRSPELAGLNSGFGHLLGRFRRPAAEVAVDG
jgi:hypothetical protein